VSGHRAGTGPASTFVSRVQSYDNILKVVSVAYGKYANKLNMESIANQRIMKSYASHPMEFSNPTAKIREKTETIWAFSTRENREKFWCFHLFVVSLHPTMHRSVEGRLLPTGRKNHPCTTACRSPINKENT
jgi:hypothetical protein